MKKGITNLHLILLTAVVVVGSFVAARAIFSPKESWQSIQAQVLGAVTSLPGIETLSGEDRQLPPPAYIPILNYHHVGPMPKDANALRYNLTVSTENFELQVAYLKGQGYESVTLHDILLYSKGKKQLPAKPVVLTFDDGYSDVFDYAVPILKKYEFVGSFAIITQFAGMNFSGNSYASWDTIRSAKKQGMEIISHTQDHFDGSNKSYYDGFILRNLQDSQKDIRDNLGTTVPVLIYPYGHYTQSYITLAEKAGFEMALTTKFGKTVDFENLMETPRIRIAGATTFEHFQQLIKQ